MNTCLIIVMSKENPSNQDHIIFVDYSPYIEYLEKKDCSFLEYDEHRDYIERALQNLKVRQIKNQNVSDLNYRKITINIKENSSLVEKYFKIYLENTAGDISSDTINLIKQDVLKVINQELTKKQVKNTEKSKGIKPVCKLGKLEKAEKKEDKYFKINDKLVTFDKEKFSIYHEYNI